MPIEIKMPALSPTMEEGTLAKWLVKQGDSVSSGDLLAEIETDKATMEFEAVDEGVIAQIRVPEGSDAVKVGTVIALMADENSADSALSASVPGASVPGASVPSASVAPIIAEPVITTTPRTAQTSNIKANETDKPRIKASPLAKRIAADKGIDLATLTGSGPGGRIVKADVEAATPQTAQAVVPLVSTAPAPASAPASAPAMSTAPLPDIPHSLAKLSTMRKTIARRLTQSKQQVPHIYLTVDIRLDKLLALRSEINGALVQANGSNDNSKISVNDLLIKALAKALIAVPQCNVSFAGNQLIRYARADISVAVSIPAGLITPIITAAETKAVSAIASEMKALATRARQGKLQPHEYQGGTASLSNMGMYGIKSFDAVINPPQAMIMAIGAGEKRPYVVDEALAIATVMSATGSFDHRAIDGADGAHLMQTFKALIENPLTLVA